MTIYKEDAATDIDAIQIWSIKELEGEFAQMLEAFQHKETEFNWEAREKYIIRIRGLLRGNATETPYVEVMVQCMKQMVDGITKAAESLRTQLAVKAFLLVEDISIFLGRYLDNYTIDQILLCMVRCSSLTKKIVASASFKATNVFIKHTSFYPKIMNMLNLSMNEKNSQIRLYAVGYIKTLLQTHAHRDSTRQFMDRTTGVMDHFENIITKGLNDPTPAVKEVCREAFWIFWEHWRDRGDHILKQLPSVAQKQLEKSKNTVKPTPIPVNSRSIHSSNRAPSSLGRGHHDIIVSPSNSNTSNGSSSNSAEPHNIKRSMSPRGTHLQQQQHFSPMPSSSTSPTPPPTSNLRKTRVPTLNRKKSSVGLLTKRKTPHFMTLLSSDDITLRADGLVQLSKKLAPFPYTPIVDLHSIHMDVPNAPPVDGEILKSIVLNQWEENYEVLSSWDSVTGIMLKLLTFEEYIPKLILDVHMDDSSRRSEADTIKNEHAKLGFARAKLFLQCENPDLIDILFTSLVQYGNFVTTKASSSFNNTSKKDITRLPANRRKLTKQFLEWMDELVTPLIGLNEDVDYTQRAYEGVPDAYTANYAEKSMNTTCWFESDDNIRQCLAILLPLITTSTSGTMWHAPLVTFMKHIRLLNQRLFETVTATYDEYSVNKICRVLGIHIRIEPPVTMVTSFPSPTLEEVDHIEEVEDIVEVKMELPVIDDESEEEGEEEEEEEEVEDISKVKMELPVIGDESEKVEDVVAEKENEVVEQVPAPILEHETMIDNEIIIPDTVIATTIEETVVEPPTTELEKIDNIATEPAVEVTEQPEASIIEEENKEEERSAGMVTMPELTVHENEDVVEPVSKLSMQERNTILDHDIPSPAYHKALPPLSEEAPLASYSKPEQEEPVQEYFTTRSITQSIVNNNNMIKPEVGPIENNSYGEYVNHTSSMVSADNLIESDLPTDIPYANHHNDAPGPDIRTGSSAEPVQPNNNNTTLPCSIPNTEKYPVPTYVSFFAPEKVNYPSPVFKHNARTAVTTNGSTTTGGRNLKDKTVLLYALIDKLKQPSPDYHQTFRKLIRLFKEVPVRRRWDQGGIEENGSETWAGSNGDAGNFVELVQSILYFLHHDQSERYLTVTLECIRQLAVNQVGLFRFYERKVDVNGQTLESQLMEKLLQIRSNENPTICIAAEDALDAVLGTLNPPTAFEMLMAFIIHRLLISPCIEASADIRYHPVGSAFMYLAKWVKEMNDTFYIDEWLGKGGVNAFFKGINHPMINIRKSCVEAIVAFQEVIGDDMYLCLVDLREDQLSLLKHYVAKAFKKKASLRNLRDNGQF